MNSTDRQAVVATHFDAYAADNRWGDLYNRANPHSHSFLARRRKTMELLGDLRGKRLLDKEFQKLFLELGCRIADERFYNKLLLPYPVTRLMPMIAFAVARVLEPIRGFSFLATGYILACEK